MTLSGLQFVSGDWSRHGAEESGGCTEIAQNSLGCEDLATAQRALKDISDVISSRIIVPTRRCSSSKSSSLDSYIFWFSICFA